ncbi:MAG: hypothetical protein IPK15_23560 [Verrucomicrobia bacterium]|nr:hypothetical protein [Verrucomicrobiota bacterium]
MCNRPAGAPTMVVRGNGRETPLPATQGDEHLILDNALVSATNINVSRLVLTNGAVLTHPGADTVVEHRLLITANTLTISTNSRIDVSARGYLGGLRDGNAANAAGRTLGNTTVGGSLRRNGGSYGGVGGFGSAEAFANAVYGSFRDPNEVGSGGGSDSDPAGNGGGLVRISVETLNLEGQILANGGAASTWGGGGSGGGIKITAGTLSGGGSMQAIGGSTGSGQPGGGGGGRIAVYYGAMQEFDLAQLSAEGGDTAASRNGASGTIFVQQTGQAPTMVVRGNGRETPLPATQEMSI